MLEVRDGGLADRVHAVVEPANAHGQQILFKERRGQLRGEQRDVLDDRKSHAPLPVGCELCDGGEERLGELLDADHGRDGVEGGDDVESDFGELVSEQLEEEGKEMLHGGAPAKNPRKALVRGEERVRWMGG